MKKILTILCLATAMGLQSCSDEEALSPSYADTDRIPGLLDTSIPTVKEYKDNYGINMLYQFNDTLDFKFGFYQNSTNWIWHNIIVTKLDTKEKIDYAFDRFNEDITPYFNDTFKQMMPKKILMADMVEVETNPDNLMKESDVMETGTVGVMASKFSYMFAYNMEAMESFNATKLANMRKTKLFHLICTVITNNNLYDEMPADFSSEVKHLYGASIDSLALEEAELPVGTGPYASYYLPSWYIEMGFPITLHSPYSSAGSNFQQRLRKGYSLSIPTFERDLRNFVCAMVFETEANIKTYYLPSELFCNRMRIALETMKKWGIDVEAINPAMKLFLDN
ncbi:MAG: hypothetical protein ACI4B3_04690 [Prevotella sp.]